jgi:hypothetical protein
MTTEQDAIKKIKEKFSDPNALEKSKKEWTVSQKRLHS